jgi:hypothetical protein
MRKEHVLRARTAKSCYLLDTDHLYKSIAINFALSQTSLTIFPVPHGDGSKPWYLVNPKIAGKWMFIPLKMYLGIDPYPHERISTWTGAAVLRFEAIYCLILLVR